MNPRIVVAIVSLVLAFTSGWLVKGWQTDAKALDAYQEAVARGNEMGARLELTLGRLEQNKFIVQRETHHETTKQIYSDCVLPDSGVRLFNKSAGHPGEP